MANSNGNGIYVSFALMFAAFSIATIVITLILVQQVYDAGPPTNVDHTALAYVRIANWIYVGFLALGMAMGLKAAYWDK